MSEKPAAPPSRANHPNVPSRGSAPAGGPPASGTTAAERARLRRRPLRPALTRYRVMAYVTGSFLLLLCVEMVLKYGFNNNEPVLGDWIAIVHGWIYVIYLMTVIDLWSTLRWPIGRLVQLVLAGVVPVVSFVAERKVTHEVTELMRVVEPSHTGG